MVTPEQIAALKYLITKARDGNETIRLILFFLIDASNGLTEEVSITLTHEKDGYLSAEIKDAAVSLDMMEGESHTTHLYELMKLMGAELCFSASYGHYDEMERFNTEGAFSGYKHLAPGHEHDRDDLPFRITFWLAKKKYGFSEHGKTLMTPSRSVMRAIDLTKPELYPSLESGGR